MLPKFKSRHDVEQCMKELGFANFINEIEQLAVPSNQVKETLYHLSFNDKLAGKVLKPIPASHLGNRETTDELFHEYAPVRLSCSPSIVGCYYALFMVLDNLIANAPNGEEEVTMSLYSVHPLPKTKVPRNQDIVDNFLIQDAHMTLEYGVLGPFKLKLLRDITFRIPQDIPDEQGIWYYPYNDRYNYERRFLAHRDLNSVDINI